MKLNFTINTDEIGDDYGKYMSFENLLTSSLRQAVIDEFNSKFESEEFKKFSESISSSLKSQLKVKLSNFLEEEIVLTDKWGKPNFIGSIDDLFKSRIDDIILKPVDSNGKQIIGCTTSGNQTWIEWEIKRLMESRLAFHIKQAEENIGKTIKRCVAEKLEEVTEKLITEKITGAFSAIMGK